MTDEGLDRFLESARARRGPEAARGPTHNRVEGIFEELELPFTNEGEIWAIDTDVGDVRAGLNEDATILSLWQPIHPLREKPKKLADYFATLLRVNAGTRGACFCLDTLYDDDPTEWVVLMSRLSAEALDKEEVSLALEGLLRMSALYDQASE